MPLIFNLLPIAVLIIALIFIIFKKIVRINKKQSCTCMFVYWIVVGFVELLFILSPSDTQFIPPSFVFSLYYGTWFTIFYLIYILFKKNNIKEKILYSLIGVSINYVIFPIIFINIGVK